MTIQTDLNVSPYFDDYTANSDYYRILFRPGVAVQVRELNQLQAILQNQIEKFGDNVFKRGTIIDGCNFNIIPYYPYAKILDLQIDGQPVTPGLYNGLYAKNSSNLVSSIVNFKAGFETRDPDLNTLYFNYINSGDSKTDTAYAAGQTLTVYDSNNIIYKVNIVAGSSAFTNSDVVHIVSAIGIQNSTGGLTFANGGFTVGQKITQATTGSTSVIVDVDTTTNNQIAILKVRPESTDLANVDASSSEWSFSEGFTITSNTTSSTANVVSIIGSSATATLVTDGAGVISSVAVTNRGTGYYVPPYVAVQSGSGIIGSLNLTAQNYIAQVTVASTANAVGNGYAFGVSDGIIYQKGHFLRVDPQVVVVEKYNQFPDSKVVGFDTIETIINSNIDTSLLDNSTGTLNTQAPGANRLKLTPVLTVMSSANAEANSNFFTIIEFAEGRPFKQNRKTQYNAIGDEIALRSYEQSGNFIIDKFNVATKSPNANSTQSSVQIEANNFNLVVDRGHGYINGKRVITQTTFEDTIPKSTTSQVVSNTYINVSYGNYVLVKELAGNFFFPAGTQISLRDTAGLYLTNNRNRVTSNTAAAIAASGAEIGKARIRSLVYEAGTPGTPDAVYRMYLFDVEMNAGKSFKNVKSVYLNTTDIDGIADIYLTYDATSNTNVAQIQQQGYSTLILPSGLVATKAVNNFTYEYRTISFSGIQANTQGIVELTLSGSETFPYTGSLSANDKEDLVIVPLANTQATTNATGTITTLSTSPNLVGSSTTFLADFTPGDYVLLSDGTNSDIRRVEKVVNNTLMIAEANASYANTTVKAKMFYPHNVPLNLFRAGRGGNVSVNQQSLKIAFGNTIPSAVNVAVSYTVKVANASLDQKVVNRDAKVRLNLANNAASNSGPWCLGVPEIIRLKGVYKSTDVATVNLNSDDVTSHFFIDSNHTEDYLDLGFLYKKPTSTLALTTSDALLVVYDALTRTGDGPATVSQYPINDTLQLANASATMHTLEIPEVFSNRDNYYDLRDCIDFRPRVVNTAVVTATLASSNINPIVQTAAGKFGNTVDPNNNKKFPVPGSDNFFTAEYYLGRKDRVVVTGNSDIKIIGGTPDSLAQAKFSPTPQDSLTIATLIIPPYPSMPLTLSAEMYQYAETNVINQKATGRRRSSYTISVDPTKVQTRGYTMNDIGKLERRIEALEYISQLSSIEDSVKNINIPSSIDPLTNRFKFGFFADNFTSLSLTDYSDPEYNATILDGVLTAKLEQLNIPLENTGNNTITFEEYDLINQPGATDGPVILPPVVLPPVVTPVSNVVVTPVVIPPPDDQGFTLLPDGTIETTTSTICVRQSSTSIDDQSFKYILSANSGSSTLYFLNYNDSDMIEIYQSTSPEVEGTLIKQLDAAVNMTTAEKQTYFENTPVANFSTVTIGGKIYASGVGKLNLTHNPANGVYYTVKTKKSTSTSKWVYVLCYPYDSAKPEPVVEPPPPPPPPTRYAGTMKVTPSNYTSGTIVVTPIVTPVMPIAPSNPEASISISDPNASNTSLSNNAITPPVLNPGFDVPITDVSVPIAPEPINIEPPVIITVRENYQEMNEDL